MAELLALKQEFESLTGKPFDAKPKPIAMQEKEKKETEKTEAAKEGSGAGLPSKKELNKMEKKKKREEHSSLHKPIPHAEEKDMKTSLSTVYYFHSSASSSSSEENETSSSFFFPLLSATVAAMLKTSITFMPSSSNKEQEGRTPHLPYLISPNQQGNLSTHCSI